MKYLRSFLFLVVFLEMARLSGSGVERYGIYVGSNKGGDGRTQLSYAGSDAKNIRKVMADIGGIPEENSFLLLDPDKNEIDYILSVISEKIIRNSIKPNRSEFLFYYSGHSDEDGLFLGNQKYEYEKLKTAISEIPTDIHVVILDSCYSGNFIRSKGGQRKKPFLIDDSSIVKGHAYLSSSSESESSQESDEIGASFFTNSIITGLRGAADSSGDKKVTLNELYSYAFNDTLKKTENSKSGPQHPNFNITLVGSGDLVLSDFSEADSLVSISKEIKGKLIFRNGEGKLVSEINKFDSTSVLLALPRDVYTVTLINESEAFQSELLLRKNETLILAKKNFESINQKKNIERGNPVFEKNQEEKKSRFQIYQENNISCGTFVNIPVVKGKAYIPMAEFPASIENMGVTFLYEFPSQNRIHAAIGGTLGTMLGDPILKLAPEVKLLFPVYNSQKLIWNIETSLATGIFAFGGPPYGQLSIDLTMINRKNKGFYGGFGFYVDDIMEYKDSYWFKRYLQVENTSGFMHHTNLGFHFFLGTKI